MWFSEGAFEVVGGRGGKEHARRTEISKKFGGERIGKMRGLWGNSVSSPSLNRVRKHGGGLND